MSKLPIVAVAALGLMTATASAQMTPSTPHATGGAPASTAPAKRAPQPNPLAQADVSKIDGAAVFDSSNKNIGHVSTVLMEPQSKKIDKLVVAAGGVLGIGAHQVAIPLDQFSWDADQDGFKLKMDETALKTQPAWNGGEQTASGSSSPPSGSTAPANAGR